MKGTVSSVTISLSFRETVGQIRPVDSLDLRNDSIVIPIIIIPLVTGFPAIYGTAHAQFVERILQQKAIMSTCGIIIKFIGLIESILNDLTKIFLGPSASSVGINDIEIGRFRPIEPFLAQRTIFEVSVETRTTFTCHHRRDSS